MSFFQNETKPVQMMFKKDKFPMTYIGDLETKVLELPYVGNELSMIILLPDAIQDESTGLEKVSCWAKSRQFVSGQGSELGTACEPAVQSQSYDTAGAQDWLKYIPYLPAPKVACILFICPRSQRLWKKIEPSSGAGVSCGYGEALVGGAAGERFGGAIMTSSMDFL